MTEHPLDRLMRHLRLPIIVLAYASFPVFLLSYGFAMKWLITTAPLWASIPSVISHILVMLGLAYRIDTPQAPHPSSEASQSPRLRRP